MTSDTIVDFTVVSKNWSLSVNYTSVDSFNDVLNSKGVSQTS